MTGPNFYNEHDLYAAAWLRNLIAAGHIAPGVVDALRLAGWPDDRPVWTGSCPCQPFSAAGKGKGHEDERHLWPAWFRLIEKRRPPVVFGEQVASADGLAWLDPLCTDMEGAGYAIAAANLPAAGVGAPHIRARLFFVADAGSGSLRGRDEHREHACEAREVSGEAREQRIRADGGADGGAGLMADADGRLTSEGSDSRLAGLQRSGEHRLQPEGRRARGEQRIARLLDGERPALRDDADGCGAAGLLADAEGGRLGQGSADASRGDEGARPQGAGLGPADDRGGKLGHAGDAGLEGRAGRHSAEVGRDTSLRSTAEAGEPRGFWSACDWLPCRDGKARPVEPGTFPLAHGAPARVGRLRAYGNAIVPQAAAAVIGAFMERQG